MFFRNLQLYRLQATGETAESIEKFLADAKWAPCGPTQVESHGWVPTRRGGPLVEVINGQWLLSLQSEKRLLPASVLKRVLQERVETIEKTEGRRVGRTERRELRDAIEFELLPQAFTQQRRTAVWIDPKNGWIGVDTASAKKADEVLSLLWNHTDGTLLGNLPRIAHDHPATCMASWLLDGEAPGSFTIDQDCEVRSPEDATVRYKHHALDGDDLRHHLAAGKLPTKLALTWNERISFVLTDGLAIKGIAFLDVATEQRESAEDQDEQMELDFTLMAGEFARLADDLVEALGGEIEE